MKGKKEMWWRWITGESAGRVGEGIVDVVNVVVANFVVDVAVVEVGTDTNVVSG